MQFIKYCDHEHSDPDTDHPNTHSLQQLTVLGHKKHKRHSQLDQSTLKSGWRRTDRHSAHPSLSGDCHYESALVWFKSLVQFKFF